MASWRVREGLVLANYSNRGEQARIKLGSSCLTAEKRRANAGYSEGWRLSTTLLKAWQTKVELNPGL